MKRLEQVVLGNKLPRGPGAAPGVPGTVRAGHREESTRVYFPPGVGCCTGPPGEPLPQSSHPGVRETDEQTLRVHGEATWPEAWSRRPGSCRRRILLTNAENSGL